MRIQNHRNQAHQEKSWPLSCTFTVDKNEWLIFIYVYIHVNISTYQCISHMVWWVYVYEAADESICIYTLTSIYTHKSAATYTHNFVTLFQILL